jgi:N-acetylglucosamine-6-phosphate deacetylase
MKLHGSRMLVDGVLREATLSVDESGVFCADSDDLDVHDLGGAIVIPGYVDQHCHGGGGADFATTDADQARAAAMTHLQRGTTSVVASLVTATTSDLLAQIATLAPLVHEGTLAGIHLEGPWLSGHQCGAHDPALLRPPDLAEVAALTAAADGTLRMVTIAAELPGAMDAIRYLRKHGVAVALGHTDCDYDVAKAAIDAGVTVATHLLNRMRPLGKRKPGPVLALVNDPRVTIELIADGVHVHPDVLRFFANVTGEERTAIISDAMAAAGAPEGDYLIGALPVRVADGVARLADTAALAGSTLTMDAAMRHVTQSCGFDLPSASRMLSGTPAAAMGLSDRGALAVGRRADLVVLDDNLVVRAVMQRGRWVVGAPTV